jgi:hypothetical protein
MGVEAQKRLATRIKINALAVRTAVEAASANANSEIN